MERLDRLTAGQPIPYGGTRVARVSDELAAAFNDGDSLIVLQDGGDLLHVPADVASRVRTAVDSAVDAFAAMAAVSDDQISEFFDRFAAAITDDDRFLPIAEANDQDVAAARQRGRSVTRLVLTEGMRRDMIDGLRSWRDAPSGRGRVLGTVDHKGWSLDLVADGLGVVGFVFEGRPNVFTDATGVLRSGNTVVFRIGSDALGTARAIVSYALAPALAEAGLPPGAAVLIDEASRSAGWALFDDRRLGLAVARGSGRATAQLGAVARQAGNTVSLHGTGGAWIVAAASADPGDFAAAVYHSLDRKVCNSLNTCCIVAERADDLVPVFLEALEKAGARLGTNPKLHVLEDTTGTVPDDWFGRVVPIARPEGDVDEPQADVVAEGRLGEEWEWEGSPEVTLAVVDDVAQAVAWFNRYSPRFVASLVSADPAEHDRFFAAIDAPFVGDGFTRWVDGQYALDKPELGLSNWEHGRLFARGGILSGDSVYTVRARVRQTDPDVGR